MFLLSFLQKEDFRFSAEQYEGNIWKSCSSLHFVEKHKNVINLIISVPNNMNRKNP